MKAKLETMYLDFVNHFLTVAYFAEYYGIRRMQTARRILDIGRRLNQRH